MRLTENPNLAIPATLIMGAVVTATFLLFIEQPSFLQGAAIFCVNFLVIHFSNYFFPGYAKSITLSPAGVSFETYFTKVVTISWHDILDIYDMPNYAGVVVLTRERKHAYRMMLSDRDRYSLMGWCDEILPLLPGRSGRDFSKSGFCPDPIPTTLQSIVETLKSKREAKPVVYDDKEYDVAISYASEDRGDAKKIADGVRAREYAVFYDEYETSRLWGLNLADELDRVFRSASKFCVILASSAYAAKKWPSRERQSAIARDMDSESPYILIVRIDDTPLPGLPSTISHLDLRQVTHAEVVNRLVEKIESHRN